MNSKKHYMFKIVTFLLFQLCLLTSIYSQKPTFEKEVFIYKEIQDHEIKSNIFLPITNQKLPVVVYFHGGGFIFGNRDQGLEDVLRDKLLQHNYAVVSADYRLAPETKLDEILTDVSDVIQWLRKNGEKQFNIDIGKIAVAGGSAAGYLALSTGYNVQPPPQAIIAISTPTDFSNTNIQKGDASILKQPGPYEIVSNTIVSYGDYSTRLNLWRFLVKNRLAQSEIFGFDVSQDTTQLKSYMLTRLITSDFPPTLLLHAKNDHLIGLPQVEKFNTFLIGMNVDSELYLAETGHSSQLINNNPDAVEKIVVFLDEHLK